MQVERQIVVNVALDVVWAHARVVVPDRRVNVLKKSAWRGDTGGAEMSLCDHKPGSP